ncbi:hypothetical protein BP5796_00023 [Coleophoma crateriformis]|uniref:Carboxylic ester hydrolase n=1 Tax=Coleophoma crateriformis TaxID=565419 RepID=A0A3D8T6W0_9HELO|nr:hypothetical protein BP5796_00023 [Coleophoma crateriformis]
MATTQVTVTLPTQTSPQFNQTIIGKKSAASAEIDEFLGIPYGVIPARWKHSHLRTSLPSDEFHALKNGPKCPQLPEPNSSEGGFNATIPFPADVTESEFDCLNLFVVRPSREALVKAGFDPEAPLPVLTWIHGGGLGFGACTDPMWNPTNLVLESLRLGKPFVAVYLNYRLGVFGFLATSAMLEIQKPDEVHGLNFGLRDQKVGLQWVFDNIAAFGGDPERITIAGQSAGGNSVNVHALEAKLNGSSHLFSGAILQSGAMGTIGPVSVEAAEGQWNNLCQRLGVVAEDKFSKLLEMEKIGVADLIAATRKMMWLVFPVVNDKITIDFTNKLEPLAVNLGETSVGLVRQRITPILVLLGEVDEEGYMGKYDVEAITNYQTIADIFFSSKVEEAVIEKMLQLYGIAPKASLKDIHTGLYRFLTEVQFSYPLFKNYKLFAGLDAISKPDVLGTSASRYKVNFGNPFRDGPGGLFGISHHCVDMIYIFNAFPKEMADADARLDASEPSNIDLRKHMQKDWIQFITREPTEDSISSDDTILQYDKDRVVRHVLPQKDEFYTAQLERLEFLEEHLPEIWKALKAFTGTNIY